VRQGDLHDVIDALSAPAVDQERVREAAIRLKANLQMEEAERERAMNGGSAINLPNIAQTIRDAATPRAQELSTRVAAAWGNWRRGATVAPQPAPALVSSVQSTSTPAKPAAGGGQQPRGFLSGLLTPPATGARPGTGGRVPQQQQQQQQQQQGPLPQQAPQQQQQQTQAQQLQQQLQQHQQQTAFANTSRRLTPQKNQARRNITPIHAPAPGPSAGSVLSTPTRSTHAPSALAAAAAVAAPASAMSSPSRNDGDREPSTPVRAAYAPARPGLQQAAPVPSPRREDVGGYDSDAQAAEFDDEDFFEEDE
jgi:hypothetical protein